MVNHMLPVNHIHQENDCYCGPASAQMVLKFLKKNIEHQYDLFIDESHELISGGTQPAEADICRYKIEHDAVWTNGSTPKGLKGTLQKRVDASKKGHVGWFASRYGGGMTRKICWAIVHHKIPPIALVDREGHWLVVAGCELSSDPTSSTDHGYSIERLHLLDPYTKIADGTPLRDIALTISRCDWQRTFFTGAPSIKLEHNRRMRTTILRSSTTTALVNTPTKMKIRVHWATTSLVNQTPFSRQSHLWMRIVSSARELPGIFCEGMSFLLANEHFRSWSRARRTTRPTSFTFGSILTTRSSEIASSSSSGLHVEVVFFDGRSRHIPNQDCFLRWRISRHSMLTRSSSILPKESRLAKTVPGIFRIPINRRLVFSGGHVSKP